MSKINFKVKSKSAKQKRYKVYQRISISEVLLAIMHGAGEFGIEFVKAFFPHPYYHTFCNHNHKTSVYHAAKRLENRKLIYRNSSGIFKLTKKGEKESFFAYINAEIGMKNKYRENKNRQKWDRKWRIIFFDIPEKIKEKREYLRSVIKALGFKELQKSVWFYPYEIPDFLLEILREENMLQYTRFISTNRISYDLDMKRIFSLK